MKFVFWQNIISIHQSAFLNALTAYHALTLVVETDIEEERKGQGWNIPGLEKINVVVAPTEKRIQELLDQSAIHVFSGIDAYSMVSKAFSLAVKKGLRTGLLMEPFKWIGFKGKLRWIKYYLLSIRFGKKIDFIAATGALGTLQYEKVGFDKSKIFEWGYFVEHSEQLADNDVQINNTGKPSVLFVGSIDERKNIIAQIEAINKLSNKIETMTIVGDGPLKEKLKSKIKDNPLFNYKGNLPNSEVKKIMYSHDILILPSKFDGWGAVVNEALHAGMRVIVSENCGAAVLLDGEVRGEQFYFDGVNDFELVLSKWLNKGELKYHERLAISEWAKDHISGKIAAEYFVDIINHVYTTESTSPVAPWKS